MKFFDDDDDITSRCPIVELMINASNLARIVVTRRDRYCCMKLIPFASQNSFVLLYTCRNDCSFRRFSIC